MKTLEEPGCLGGWRLVALIPFLFFIDSMDIK